MHHRARFSVCVSTVATLVSACGGAAKPPVDSQATSAATEAAPAPAPGPASKIGKLPLLAAASPAGKCSVRDVPPNVSGKSGIVRDLFYESEFPTRNVSLAVGDTSRAYRPITVTITATQPAGSGYDDVETLWVLFHPNGDVRSGTRDYKASDNSASEKSGLLPEDTAAVKQLIATMFDACHTTP